MLALGAFVLGLAVKALPNVKFVLAAVATVSVGRHYKCRSEVSSRGCQLLMKIPVQALKCQSLLTTVTRLSLPSFKSSCGASWLHDRILGGPTRCVSTGCGVHMAFVTIRDGEPPEGIVSRFRAAVTRGGILKEHKDRRFFRSKGEKQRLAARRSARRRRRVTSR